MHDLVIKNAVIVDGLGNPGVAGELAVKDGRIAAVGTHVGAGSETVDAAGLTLAPGIIDLHTHFDAQLTWDPYATPSNRLGVTTVVIGNCGFTIAPCKPEHRERTLKNLTHVEGMSLAAMQAGIDWDFVSFPDYMNSLERRGLVPNVAAFCGHSSVRTWVLGDDASDRAATATEVAEMKALVREALDAGACGFATSTLEQHNGDNGIPMPSRLADEHEMFELTGALGEAGRGAFMLTKGMKTTVPWLEGVAAKNGRPVMIAAMFVDPGDPDRVFREVAEIEQARDRGRELWSQVGCFPLGMEFSLEHPYPMEALIGWRSAMEAEGTDEFKRIIADPNFRQALKTEMNTTGVPNRFSSNNWDHMTIMSVHKPAHADLIGKTVGPLAREAGQDPWDWFLDFGLADDLKTMFDVKLFNVDEDRVVKLLQNPAAAITLSDAGAHLSFFCDAGFGLHLLGHWARDRGDMSIEYAVQALTSRAADIYRIKDRGRLVPGAWADLMLFDPKTVGRGEKRRVSDLPTGADRIDTPAIGLHGVWVNGIRTVDEAGDNLKDCGTPGQLLRDFADVS
ncbi:MAG: amidohydrolase family protein [Alphaproteobacteria bacterium]|nr:amidohydrolase family protein [Alphaproteobacteria bacterium]